MATVITPPHNPIPEIQTEDEVRIYVSKLQKLTRSELCAELSNVMAAKHNLMMIPSGASEALEKQRIVTDLTDKAVYISILEFGHEVVLGYAARDIRQFNELINKIDEEFAQQDIDPDQHGSSMLRKLSESLKINDETDRYSLSLTLDEKASLAGALGYMIEYPDVYVNQYEFYGEDTYLHNKIDIIVTLKKKYDQEAANILSSTGIQYSNEELLVIWTIINIMIQIIGDDESKKEDADVFSSLMQKFVPLVAKAEKSMS